MKYFHLLLAFITATIFSCDGSFRQELNQEVMQISVKDTIDVSLPDGYSEGVLKLWHSGKVMSKDYLFDGTYEEGQLSINVLDAIGFEYLPTIHIPQHGPNGFKAPSPSFLVVNFDSIFVFPTSINKVYLYDSSGIKKSEYAFSGDYSLSFDSNEELQSTAYHNDQLFLHAIPYANPNVTDFFEKTYASYSLNLTNSKLTKNLRYPDHLMGKVLPTSFLGAQLFVAFDSLLITNHYFSNKLRVQSLKNVDEDNMFEAGLTGFDHLNGLKTPINNQSMESIQLQVQYPGYRRAFYDPYRKRIYRVVNHLARKFLRKDINAIMQEASDNNPELYVTSLIEIDENLSVTRVMEVPSSDFYIPTKDGLLIQSNEEGTGLSNRFLLLDLN